MDTVLTAVQGVNWRTLGKKLLLLDSTLDKIEKVHKSDDGRLRDVLEHWMHGIWCRHEEPSWRSIIWGLDGANETRTADSIRHFAEPVQGKSYHSISVSTFLYSV